MLTKKYQIAKGPPPPVTDDYIAVTRKEWQQLLAANPDEREVQSFLERNPMFLPGALTPGMRSGHEPLHFSAISQPILPGLRSKIPDFMWIAKHSAAWYPTLIEIERPSKRLFTSKGVPTAAFTQARDQLADWRTWFSKPENVQTFITTYGIPDYVRRGRVMKLHMILIYGRRAEVEHIPHLSEKRSALLSGSDEELMSFDRLGPDVDISDAITVKAVHPGQYRAIAIPPTFEFSPVLAERLIYVDGIEECLAKTPMISEERRKFLLSRLPYWKEQARNGCGGMVCPGDRE